MAHPILLIPEWVSASTIEALVKSKPGDIIGVPDGFRIMELDPERKTMKESGFQFELTSEGLKRLE